MDVPQSREIVVGAVLLILAGAFLFVLETGYAVLAVLSRRQVEAVPQVDGTGSSPALERLERSPRLILSLGAARLLAAGSLALGGWLLGGLWGIPGRTLGLLLALFLWGGLWGYAVPRGLAAWRPEGVAAAFTPVLLGLLTLFSPVTSLWEAGARRLTRLLGAEPPAPLLSVEEVWLLARAGKEGGILDSRQVEMLEGIVDLRQTTVREVMVPRVDVVAIPETATLSEALDRVLESGHSRLPVYRGTIDRVVGVFYVKDLLRYCRGEKGRLQDPVGPLAREPFFVPESQRVEEVLREMQRRRVHLAVVVDEYGGTAGIVTLEDLMELIVGDIQDEYDAEEPEVRALGPRRWEVDARLDVEDLEELLGLEILPEEFDTVGGFLVDQLGHLPQVGETVEYQGWRFRVLSLRGRGIGRVQVEPGPQPSPEASSPSSSPEEGEGR